MAEQYDKKRKYPKKEGNFLKEFMKEFSQDEDMWFFKSHGEPMQTRGIPDVLMCYRGIFAAIEFKIMRSGKVSVTPYQEHTINKIKGIGGMAFVVFFDEANAEIGVGIKRFKNRTEAIAAIKQVLNFGVFEKVSLNKLDGVPKTTTPL